MLDAVVVGSGPNGLAAAITLAQAGRSVRVYEAGATPGGGMRSAELTLPGVIHDVCSTVQTAALASPFFGSLGLDLPVCQPEVPFAHPLGGTRAAALYRSVEETAAALGSDGAAWRGTFGPLVGNADKLWPDILGDLRHVPRHPIVMTRFGLKGLSSALGYARRHFDDDEARALLAGVCAHSMRRLDAPFTAAFGMVLATMGHALGWPVIRGGSNVLADLLVQRLSDLGGEIVCDAPVTSLADLPPSRLRLLDVGPAQLLRLAGDDLPGSYRFGLRHFRYGPGVFKIDYALSEPVPWSAEVCRRAGTVHVGGTMEEIAASEAAAEAGRESDRPYLLAVQPTVADPTRAPDGKHVLWVYCHVPSGSQRDRTAAVEAQLERFAPGFADVVEARATRTSVEYEAYDANYVGGDVNGGRASLWATFLGPVPRWSRYRVPVRRGPQTYLCSSSTAPGGGVHGMCGANAARAALRHDR